jgi:ESCRT-II complex subunit VPS25
LFKRKDFMSSSFVDFPPFYTRQPVLETWQKQRSLWSEHILSYCRQHRLFRITYNQPAELFHNASINSTPLTEISMAQTLTQPLLGRASKELFDGVVEYMVGSGHLVPIVEPWTAAAGKKGQQPGSYYILWMSMEQWSQELLKWAADMAATPSTIYTVFELLEGDQCADRLFYQMDAGLLLMVLDAMERRQLVQVLRISEDLKEFGVKFIQL